MKTSKPSGAAQSHSLFVPSTVNNIHKQPPSPTVRMLTCVHYLVRPGHTTGKTVAISTLKGVLTALAQNVNREHTVALSVERIAFMSGYTERAVQLALRTALERNYLAIERRGGGAHKTTCYRVLLLDRYLEAAVINNQWNGESRSGLFQQTVNHVQGIILKKGERSAQKGERGSPDPKGTDLKTRIYKTAEETKKYLERVFAEA